MLAWEHLSGLSSFHRPDLRQLMPNMIVVSAAHTHANQLKPNAAAAVLLLLRARFCWNANSQDTGGLVEADWHTLVLPKLAWCVIHITQTQPLTLQLP
jgi:hypothetical protein